MTWANSVRVLKQEFQAWGSIIGRTKILFGELEHKEKGIATDEYSKTYDKSRYKFFLDAPFDLCGNECCKTMKKEPLRLYGRKSKRVPITAQMASESKLRTQSWLQSGCNAFDSKNPMSKELNTILNSEIEISRY